MNRRDFLIKSSATALAAAPIAALAEQIQPGHPHSTKLGWQISVQHWGYRRVPLFEGLEMAAKVGLRFFEPRSILKLDAKRPNVNSDENMPEDARKELKSRADDLGVSFPSTFADFNGQPDQAERMLEFWKSLGTSVVVTEPQTKWLDMLEPLFAEYGMTLALHNHQAASQTTGTRTSCSITPRNAASKSEPVAMSANGPAPISNPSIACERSAWIA